MSYIDTKYFFECETCRYNRTDGCNTYCDHGESYYPSLAKFPKEDVAEVKHGEWKHTVEFGRIAKHHYWNCSLCGADSSDCGRENYCPNCGAKMDGKE